MDWIIYNLNTNNQKKKMKPPATKIRVHVGSRLVKLEILAKVFPLIAARIAAYSTIPAYIIPAPPAQNSVRFPIEINYMMQNRSFVPLSMAYPNIPLWRSRDDPRSLNFDREGEEEYLHLVKCYTSEAFVQLLGHFLYHRTFPASSIGPVGRVMGQPTFVPS